jgi:predicted ATPase
MTAATNWYVIIGAPCSGKTTIVAALASQGYATVPEVARAYIDRQLAQGKDLISIKSDLLAFERRILLEKVRIEQCLSKESLTILDRAVPDSMAYYQLEGLDLAEPLGYSRSARYKKVFLFDRLKFEGDTVRTENQMVSERIEDLIHDAYTFLGYNVIRVPVAPIPDRIDFILAHIQGGKI